jgi:hypothetical protein
VLLTAGWQSASGDQARSDDFIYGRVTTTDGEVFEGRLRWGGSEEAFWNESFNGVKADNVWAPQVSRDRLKQRRPVVIFGFHLGSREHSFDLGRPFMARFGDISRIDTKRSTFRVTLKSGTVHELNRYASDDLADGVRVWDTSRGVVDLDEWAIRSIEFLPTPKLSGTPGRLHGTVYTEQDHFTGFIQWNREKGVATDALNGRGAQGDLAVPFHTIRSISRNAAGGSTVVLLEGREVVLTGTSEVGEGNRGVYVDDARYGRVLVSWDVFDRVDLTATAGSSTRGSSYDAFPPGLALTGSVTTCDGRGLTGRLVYDLDESETTETLDAPREGVDYSIPFGLISAVRLSVCDDQDAESARVVLHDGMMLELESSGDLGDANPGILVFKNDSGEPEYVPWMAVRRLDLDRR